MTCRACAKPLCDCSDAAYAGVIPVSVARRFLRARTPAAAPPLAAAGDSFETALAAMRASIARLRATTAAIGTLPERQTIAVGADHHSATNPQLDKR